MTGPDTPAVLRQALGIQERRAGIRALVGLSGDLDFRGVADLGDAVDRQLEARAHELWVDLRRLHFIDSTGLGALISARRRADDAGAVLHLVVDGGPAGEVLELGRMDRVFLVAHELPRTLLA
jgi:anti-sigma B factor antagonist